MLFFLIDKFWLSNSLILFTHLFAYMRKSIDAMHGGGKKPRTNAERVHFMNHGISEISRYRLSLSLSRSIDVPSPPIQFHPSSLRLVDGLLAECECEIFA